jgi:hypothetical protein
MLSNTPNSQNYVGKLAGWADRPGRRRRMHLFRQMRRGQKRRIAFSPFSQDSSWQASRGRKRRIAFSPFSQGAGSRVSRGQKRRIAFLYLFMSGLPFVQVVAVAAWRMLAWFSFQLSWKPIVLGKFKKNAFDLNDVITQWQDNLFRV